MPGFTGQKRDRASDRDSENGGVVVKMCDWRASIHRFKQQSAATFGIPGSGRLG